MINEFITFAKDYYGAENVIPLHAPCFKGREKQLVMNTIDSTFVSSVGAYVDQFENQIKQFTNAEFAVATVNGTSALHIALKLVGVLAGDVVITQALSFVATANAICYCGATPAFVDVDKTTLGMSPTALDIWLQDNCYLDSEGRCRIKNDDRVVRACVPMHTFGHPVDIEGLSNVLHQWNIALVEDAAESLGSFYDGQHTGTFGNAGALSFNGNKIITTGGGGIILSNHELGKKAKHLTTTAKLPHRYEFIHDEIGYNYRMPNLNAALGCGQLEQLDAIITEKRELALQYESLFEDSDMLFVKEPPKCRSNYWLNAVICKDTNSRDEFLNITNDKGIQTRPVWKLLSELTIFEGAISGDLSTSQSLASRIVNLPSSVKP